MDVRARGVVAVLVVALGAGCAPPPTGVATPATPSLVTATPRPTVLASSLAPGSTVPVGDFFAAVERGRAKEVKVGVTVEVGRSSGVDASLKGEVDASDPASVSANVAGTALVTPVAVPTGKASPTPGAQKPVAVDLKIHGDSVTAVVDGAPPVELSREAAIQRGLPVYEFRAGVVVASMKDATSSVVSMGQESQGAHFSLGLTGTVEGLPGKLVTAGVWRCDVWLDADGRVAAYQVRTSNSQGAQYLKATETLAG